MVQIQVRPPVLEYRKPHLKESLLDHSGSVTLEDQGEGRQQTKKRAADDLTIEENVLKKILQEKRLCQTQEIASSVSNLC